MLHHNASTREEEGRGGKGERQRNNKRKRVKGTYREKKKRGRE